MTALSRAILIDVSENTFDFIIAGGGMAGLSLAYHLDQSALRERSVLMIDREEKSANDHTWCFWADGPSPFDDVVFHRWKSLWFHPAAGPGRLMDLSEEGFDYRMVRASDFYGSVIPRLKENPSFRFLTSDIRDVSDGQVETDSGIFTARSFVFDSVTARPSEDPSDNNLLQHFLGWKIEADTDIFDPDAATLFDFRVPQHGECRFAYILPETRRKALVEFTVFSDNLLERKDYERELSDYIKNVLDLKSFRTLEEEFGVIPMSDAFIETRPSPRVIRIGTAGGYVKPSTGYSFARTQDRLSSLVAHLENGDEIGKLPSGSAWNALLDSVLLNVLGNRRVPAADVFDRLFARNPPGKVLRFLDEKTRLGEDLRIMSTVPLGPFMAATAREILKRIRRIVS